MKKVLICELRCAADDVGLMFIHCGGCHYQLKGGSKLVNFYDTAKGSKIFVVGESNGRFVNSVAQVIEATGAKQKSKSYAPNTILDEILEEMVDRVTISLSRDVVSLGCEDREHAKLVFSLLERLFHGRR